MHTVSFLVSSSFSFCKHPVRPRKANNSAILSNLYGWSGQENMQLSRDLMPPSCMQHHYSRAGNQNKRPKCRQLRISVVRCDKPRMKNYTYFQQCDIWTVEHAAVPKHEAFWFPPQPYKNRYINWLFLLSFRNTNIINLLNDLVQILQLKRSMKS